MDPLFDKVDFGAGSQWFDAAGRSANLVTIAQRNGAVAILSALAAALADPARVMGRDPNPATPDAMVLATAGQVPLRMPRIPYTGPDAALRGREVPLFGAIDVPSWWPSRGDAPSTIAPWLRSTDADRRRLFGALQSVLARLGAEGERTPQEGRRSSGIAFTASAPVGVVAVTGCAGWAWVRGDAGAHIGEKVATQQAAARIAGTAQMFLERLRVARDTGTMPPATAAEVALNPSSANGAPAEGSPSAEGDAWWAARPGWLGKVAAAVGVASVFAGLTSWGFSRWQAGQAAQGGPQTNVRTARAGLGAGVGR